MSHPRLLQALSGLILAGFLSASPARAQMSETWVSGAGSDGNACTRVSPCGSFHRALEVTLSGGQINVVDSGNYGSVVIDRAVAIVNDTGGTAVMDFAPLCIGGCNTAAYIQISAGPNDVVTLRGITVGNYLPQISSSYGVYIANARQVNIEKCTIRGQGLAGIFLSPNASGALLASSIDLRIQDTVVTGSAGGARINAIPTVTVVASISRSSFENNTGGGIRIDGTSGGTVTASISDSVSSMNSSNGIVAISGPGNVAVNITRSVMASNALSGVQSNSTGGGTSAVTLRASTVTNNAGGQINFFGGASLKTFGDNNIVGTSGTGFTAPVALQ